MEICKRHLNNMYIAHPGKDGISHQTVEQHLFEVHHLAGLFAKKIGQENAGKLIGLLHDFGKYSQTFQVYIKSAVGLIDSGDEEYVNAKSLKGKVDHSTAGAQWLFNDFFKLISTQYPDRNSEKAQLAIAVIQTLAQCIASHHGGLIDSLENANGKGFINRIQKEDEKTHLNECKKAADQQVLDKASILFSSALIKEAIDFLQVITGDKYKGFTFSQISQRFNLGLYTKFMFSCLIDADRISSADFEMPENKQHRCLVAPDWSVACQRVEQFVEQLKPRNSIDDIRQKISNNCREKANEKQGIYSLTVPTGGGKTYSSLRYALHHAKNHQLDRIIYIIPYTSIIDQNAQEIRKVLEQDGDNTPWVFEHHSNLEPEQQTWRSQLVSENWDAPIVLTTMVQFLETLFSDGTRGVRRLHQLANSVLVFDEIQTLPINCTHLFCNSINFLTAYCKTTALMCTATQPLLNQLTHPEKGQLHLPIEHELTPDVSQLFDELKRVNIVDQTKSQGWSLAEITQLAADEMEQKKSCLIIVNTKNWAQQLYLSSIAQGMDENTVFHLSTSQCPAHRKMLLDEIRARLTAQLPTLCISTALIEAGVDVDFNAVIRFLAGLDSIAQAAGRCNRNGRLSTAQVTVINPEQENIDLLTDINVGIAATKRIFNEYQGQDFLLPEVMQQYFNYYFYERSEEMNYPFKAKRNSIAERDDNLLNLLSLNSLDPKKEFLPSSLKHAFMTAGKLFKAIDAPTKSLIVPFGEGKSLLNELCRVSKHFNAKTYFDLVKKCQKYSVNLFPNIWQKLVDKEAIIELKNERGEGDGIFYLDERFYSDDFGVSVESCALQQELIC
ncbi:MAG: CRISPR-associated endonuclease/helicase Cas3 [Colwellia sp.]|jgi:CRISPR-associated endonuclease/helicase Cas3